MNARPSRKDIRLAAYDYASPGAYFVTVCVNPRRNLFWSHQNVGADTIRPLTKCEQIVDDAIRQIPRHYPHISIDNYCIMPDHIHILLTIHPDENGRQIAAPTLSTVIGQLKRYVSKRIGMSIWQKSFIERIIRNQKGYEKAWQYIDNNPTRLELEKEPLCFDEW